MGSQHAHGPEHHEHSHGDHSHGPGVEHQHHHACHHHHGDSKAGAAFRWSIVLNSGLTALQLTIGFGFGSLALIGDALHNAGDVVGLALGWGADRLSRRSARGRFTYGYGRRTRSSSGVTPWTAAVLLREPACSTSLREICGATATTLGTCSAMASASLSTRVRGGSTP